MEQLNKTTQDFMFVEEVRDGIVVLNDGSMKAILMASSLNFALKAQSEQEAILLQFQNFLNSLEFSTQIFIQSRRLDIKPYILMLEDRYREQDNDLIKIQTREYIEFIKNFTENTSIMSKNFFIIVSYNPPTLQAEKSIQKLIGSSENTDQKENSLDNFQENRTQLEQRISVVEQGLVRTGVRLARLGTEETVELLYKMFNPGETEIAQIS